MADSPLHPRYTIGLNQSRAMGLDLFAVDPSTDGPPDDYLPVR